MAFDLQFPPIWPGMYLSNKIARGDVVCYMVSMMGMKLKGPSILTQQITREALSSMFRGG